MEVVGEESMLEKKIGTDIFLGDETRRDQGRFRHLVDWKSRCKNIFLNFSDLWKHIYYL